MLGPREWTGRGCDQREPARHLEPARLRIFAVAGRSNPHRPPATSKTATRLALAHLIHTRWTALRAT